MAEPRARDGARRLLRVRRAAIHGVRLRTVPFRRHCRALAALEGNQPVDLLVVDYAIPGMTGAAVAAEARARRPDLRILFFTGYAEAAGLVLEPEDTLLHKPFWIAELAATVATALARPPRREPARSTVVPFTPSPRGRG